MNDISSKIEGINTQIAEIPKAEHSVRLVAVSKAQSIAAIEQAYRAGQVDMAENYCQEALEKITALADKKIIWHFIGGIQSNKAQLIAENFSWVQSVSRLKIIEALNQHRPADLPPLNICIQLKLDQDPTKAGASPHELLSLAAAIVACPRLTLRGLMVIATKSSSTLRLEKNFNQAAECYRKLQQCYPAIDILSMGMSQDFVSAIRAGATMVRVGSKIFGRRVHHAT